MVERNLEPAPADGRPSSIGRKLAKPGTACRRGRPVYYDELKHRLNVMVTPTARAQLESLAAIEQCSISELIERWARNALTTLR